MADKEQAPYGTKQENIATGSIHSITFAGDDGEASGVTYRGSLPGQVEGRSPGFFHKITDGFKRADLSGIDTENMTEAEIQAYLTSKAPLKRALRGYHLQMISFGGSIGSGLFIGSGTSFQTGGVAGVVIGFSVIGLMLLCTMQALAELTVRFPVQGAFAQYSNRFLSRSWGFAMGWNYILQWLTIFPLELIASAITLSYWDSDNNGATRVNKAAWVSLFYTICILLNLFGARGYGESEVFLSLIKVAAVIGFCIFGIVITCGGGPNHHHYGTHYWHDPGAFAHGAKGVFALLVTCAFATQGTELAGLAAAETKNPSRNLPRAMKQVLWRVSLFYVVSLTIVGCLVKYTDPRLGKHSDGRSSPFVIAIANAGVSGLPSVFNAVITLSVFSVGNSSVYAGSRTISAMAAQGFAPRVFGYIDKEGRPLVGIGIMALAGLLSFLVAYHDYNTIFNWLLALSGLSQIFTCASINLAHLRFRAAMKVQGRSLDELTYKAIGGLVTPVIGFLINIAIVGVQFWIALFPIDEKPSAYAFFKAYLSVPCILAFYLFGKVWFSD